MSSGDRIDEVYHGTLWDTDARSAAQERIAWICERVRGSRVLDIGCSQGIVSILLARGGKEVVRVDVNADAIEYAKEELAAECDSTRERLAFVNGDALQQAFEEQSFDTVIVEQLSEYGTELEAVLELARRVCKPDGHVIITSSFGLPQDPRHQRIIYLYSFAVLVSRFYVLREIDVFSECIGFLGKPIIAGHTGDCRPQSNDEEWHRTIHQLSERTFEQSETRHRIILSARSSMITALQSRIEGLRSDKQALQSRIEGLRSDKQALESRIEGLRSSKQVLQSRIEGLKSDKQALQNRMTRLQGEHSALKDSVTVRVGRAVVGAVRPSRATIALPFRLWRIYRNYKSKQAPH